LERGGANIRRNEKHGRDTGEPIGSEALHNIGSEALYDSIGSPKATRLAIPQVAKRIRSWESVADIQPQKLEPGNSLHNEMETRGGPIAVMYVRGVRIYTHRYFCVVPTPVCVIYANCSCQFYFSTPNDHVSSLRSFPLVYLLKLNSELFFFHVIFLYVFPSRAPVCVICA
jgi:hypothetical protein